MATVLRLQNTPGWIKNLILGLEEKKLDRM